MNYVSTLRKRTVAVALAGGAILFLVGFAHGYSAQRPEPGWRTAPVEQ
jgi:hypothetical protein